jgi:hypothetical protein
MWRYTEGQKLFLALVVKLKDAYAGFRVLDKKM